MTVITMGGPIRRFEMGSDPMPGCPTVQEMEPDLEAGHTRPRKEESSEDTQ